MLLLICPFLYAQDKGEAITKSPTDHSKPVKTWAVIVGISNYEKIDGLNYADKDAEAFYDYLVNVDGGPKLNASQIKLLLNENASALDIYGALDWLKESVNENDRVIFYFSGHGDIEKQTLHQNGFLLAYNCPKAAYMTSGAINIDYLQDYLEKYINVNKARDVILIADACRSGKLAGGSEGVRLSMQALGENRNSHIIKILSAQDNELSFESNQWGAGMGVFSYYLIKGLEGLANRNNDNKITTAELAAYLPHAVAEATGNVQNPRIDGDPQRELFSFNQASLNTAKQMVSVPFKTNAIVNIGIPEEIAPDILVDYRKYLDYVREGRLIWGINYYDTLNCARNVYLQLIDKPGAEAIQASLRSSFVEALQRKAQEILDNYTSEKNVPYNPLEAYKEIAYLKKLIKPDYVLYNYIMARAFFFENRWYGNTKDHHSIDLIKKVLSYERDAPYALNELAAIYSDKEIRDSAIYYYQAAISAAPKWLSPYNNIGISYEAQKNYVQAIKYYKLAIKLDTNFEMAYSNLGTVYQELKIYDTALMYHKKTIQLLERYTKMKPSYEGKYVYSTQKVYYANLGIDYQQLKDNRNALKNYLAAVHTDTACYTVYNNMGVAYQDLGDTSNAILSFKKCIQYDSTHVYVNPYYNLGNIYQGLKNYKEAIVNYKGALALDSTRADVYTNLGLAYVYSDEYKKGIACLQKTLSLNPQDIASYYNLACAYSRYKSTDKALMYLRQTLEKGYRDYQNIMQDEDMVNLRKNTGFNTLMKQYFADKMN